jgi:hypothetical protein
MRAVSPPHSNPAPFIPRPTRLLNLRLIAFHCPGRHRCTRLPRRVSASYSSPERSGSVRIGLSLRLNGRPPQFISGSYPPCGGRTGAFGWQANVGWLGRAGRTYAGTRAAKRRPSGRAHPKRAAGGPIVAHLGGSPRREPFFRARGSTIRPCDGGASPANRRHSPLLGMEGRRRRCDRARRENGAHGRCRPSLMVMSKYRRN